MDLHNKVERESVLGLCVKKTFYFEFCFELYQGAILIIDFNFFFKVSSNVVKEHHVGLCDLSFMIQI